MFSSLVIKLIFRFLHLKIACLKFNGKNTIFIRYLIFKLLMLNLRTN